MGFLRSFFAAMAANEISEKRRAQKGSLEALERTEKVLKLNQAFLDYLASINCRNVRYSDAISHIISDSNIDNDTISSYDIVQLQELQSKYKQQLKEFMRLGGNPIFLRDLNQLDLYIEIVKRLKEYGWLDKQQKYVEYADDTYWLDSDWEQEQKNRHVRNVQIPALLSTPGNSISEVLKCGDVGFVPYDSFIGKKAVMVEVAKSYDDKTRDFMQYLTISIVINDDEIIVYNYEHTEIYYRADIRNKMFGVGGVPISDDWLRTCINNLDILMSKENAKRVANFTDRHSMRVFERMEQENKMARESIDSLSGIEFEDVCKRLLENMGFAVETTKASGDGGIDLIAYNSQPLLSGKYIIQCKRYSGSVGEPIIRDLYGVVTSERANKGILMTTGVFTRQAQAFSEGKPIELIDGIKLKALLEKYCN